jgi:two-component system, repressor protein LuxO
MMAPPILLIEDTQSMQLVYTAILKKGGFVAVSAGTAAEGLAKFHDLKPKIVLLDLMLPDGNGLELMADFFALDSEVRVIVITANGSIIKAIEAMRGGAFEFLVKPFDENRLINTVENAAAASGQQRLPPVIDVAKGSEFHGFIGTSPKMREVYRKITAISRSMATVFISGESGTGKEICAQAIHATSTRARGPFVPLNCGAIPPDLLESEVFGHLKGSFTGAIADSVGAAGAADGGTLFLDEICEMDLNLQTKLLRFLQTSTVQPVGAIKARKVNVRIICATNRDPYEEVKSGRFREDLYYRLHVVPIHLPQLRERAEDPVEIAEKMLLKFAVEEGRKFTRIDPDVKDLFRRLPWPGNVRQVLNLLRNVVVLNDAETVTTTMLPLEILHLNEEVVQTVASKNRPKDPPVGLEPLIGRPLAEIERLVIEETLRLHNGSVSQASRVLDISPSTLYRKLERWNRGQ